jgi:hypothetical protein
MVVVQYTCFCYNPTSQLSSPDFLHSESLGFVDVKYRNNLLTIFTDQFDIS